MQKIVSFYLAFRSFIRIYARCDWRAFKELIGGHLGRNYTNIRYQLLSDDKSWSDMTSDFLSYSRSTRANLIYNIKMEI